MKTEHSLSKSADAALAEAIKLSRTIHTDLIKLGATENFRKHMPRIRAEASVMLQRIHEYNAYMNTLLTP